MTRFVIVAGLALALAACGQAEDQTAEDQMDDAIDQVAEAADDMGQEDMDQDDMANDAVDEMTEAADEVMDEAPAPPSRAELQAAFLEEYAQSEGVMATGSGLLYRIDRAGEGPMPGPRDTVEVHYEGRLIDGTVFDSSYARNETIEFPLDRVIPGWTEGLQLMQVGAQHQLVIPSDLAYGSRDLGTIPPNSVLVFDVELFNVTPVE